MLENFAYLDIINAWLADNFQFCTEDLFIARHLDQRTHGKRFSQYFKFQI